MTGVEVGIEMIVEDLGVEERVDLEIDIGLTPGIEGRREGFITAEDQDILSGNVKRRKGIKLSKESKRHRCNR